MACMRAQGVGVGVRLGWGRGPHAWQRQQPLHTPSHSCGFEPLQSPTAWQAQAPPCPGPSPTHLQHAPAVLRHPRLHRPAARRRLLQPHQHVGGGEAAPGAAGAGEE